MRLEDEIVIRRATWSDYEREVATRGSHATYRIAFSDGLLETRKESTRCESMRATLPILVDEWCRARGIAHTSNGLWTLRDKDVQRAVEPDASFVFGEARKARPDLAFENERTMGRLDRLELFRKLGVQELWIYRERALAAWGLRGERYELLPGSAVLTGIDLALVASILADDSYEAIHAFRLRVRGYR